MKYKLYAITSNGPSYSLFTGSIFGIWPILATTHHTLGNRRRESTRFLNAIRFLHPLGPSSVELGIRENKSDFMRANMKTADMYLKNNFYIKIFKCTILLWNIESICWHVTYEHNSKHIIRFKRNNLDSYFPRLTSIWIPLDTQTFSQNGRIRVKTVLVKAEKDDFANFITVFLLSCVL